MGMTKPELARTLQFNSLFQSRKTSPLEKKWDNPVFTADLSTMRSEPSTDVKVPNGIAGAAPIQKMTLTHGGELTLAKWRQLKKSS